MPSVIGTQGRNPKLKHSAVARRSQHTNRPPEAYSPASPPLLVPTPLAVESAAIADPRLQLTAQELTYAAQGLRGFARRAGFRCEYCGANLLLSSDVYFLGAHLDHIAPRGGGGGDGLDNLALACAPCNYLKRRADPRTGLSGPLTRDQLVQAAARIVAERRRAAKARLEAAMPFLRALL